MNALLKLSAICISISLLTSSCDSIGVFEQNVAFKNHEWAASVKPQISFQINDTTSLYNIYIVLRHSDAYEFNNIWLKVTRKGPDTTYTQQMELRLATNDKGWLGTGMDDIWENRAKITAQPASFRTAGEYQFTIEQVMRQDPLEHVLNAGIRIEKVAQ